MLLGRFLSHSRIGPSRRPHAFSARTKGTLRVLRPWALGLVTALSLIRLCPGHETRPQRGHRKPLKPRKRGRKALVSGLQLPFISSSRPNIWALPTCAASWIREPWTAEPSRPHGNVRRALKSMEKVMKTSNFSAPHWRFLLVLVRVSPQQARQIASSASSLFKTKAPDSSPCRWEAPRERAQERLPCRFHLLFHPFSSYF